MVFISFRADAERGESSLLQSSRRRARVTGLSPQAKGMANDVVLQGSYNGGGGVVGVRHVDEDGCSLYRGFRDRKPKRIPQLRGGDRGGNPGRRGAAIEVRAAGHLGWSFATRVELKR